jgi:hypothetical protein
MTSHGMDYLPPGLATDCRVWRELGRVHCCRVWPAPGIVLTSYGWSLAFVRTSLDILQTGLYRLPCKSLHFLILFLTIPKKL